jgi:hypothetical protein
MPDGEILHGEYQVTENVAAGVSIPGMQIGTTVRFWGQSPRCYKREQRRGKDHQLRWSDRHRRQRFGDM